MYVACLVSYCPFISLERLLEPLAFNIKEHENMTFGPTVPLIVDAQGAFCAVGSFRCYMGVIYASKDYHRISLLHLSVIFIRVVTE